MSAVTTSERAELMETASEIARRELAPRAGALDAAQPETLAECWRQLCEVGFDRALLDEQYGGPGLGIDDLLLIVEELAVGDGGTALRVLLANAALAMRSSERAGAIAEGARWAVVPTRMNGELTLAEGRLSGSTAPALGAHEADGVVLLVQGPEPFAVTLEPGAANVSYERETAQMGLRAAPAASLAIGGLEHPSSSEGGNGRAPSGNGGPAEVATGMALLRAGTASIARGITRRAHSMARAYAHERRQGGKTIVEYDAVADMLAQMAIWIACPLPAARTGAQALALKISASDAALRSTIDAVQVFGGTGYMHETGVEKLMRDAKYCQLYPEPNWIAQDALVHLQHAPDVDLLAWPAAVSGNG